MRFKIKGNLVDVYKEKIYPAEIVISENKIESINSVDEVFSGYILPGLVDSHVHVESSMLTPAGFSELAVKQGTVAVVSDPHEIANVAGLDGIQYMIESGKSVPLKFFFGAPSCVPATEFESSGARIDPEDVEKLLMRDDIYFLSEIMNYPGVITRDKNIIRKIDFARKLNKPIDGHAPGIRGDDLERYIQAGIGTDHECVSLVEAEEKISKGMKIQIREGSAAKGFDLFCNLIDRFPEDVMLCTDDIHPDDLISGHINKLLANGVKKGLNLFNLIRAASINPALYYNLPVGMLRAGDYADMIIVEDLVNFKVSETYIDGKKIYSYGDVLFKINPIQFDNKFRTHQIAPNDLLLVAETDFIRIIEVRDGELYTGSKVDKATIIDGFAVADTKRDICKIVVVDKYNNRKPVTGFISGFGLKDGAIAGSIAHDSHNIIAIGVNDGFICDAVNTILDMQGGIAAVSSNKNISMQLEIAGLMTSSDGKEVAAKYKDLDEFAKFLGSALSAPYMSLSFMALLVIPELKIGDRGLFDVNNFRFTSVFVK